MRIKPDLYSGRLFECWEPKKRDHQTLRVISHRNMKINAATGVSTRHKVTTMMSGDIVTKTKNIRVGSRSGGWLLRWKKVLGGRIPYSISMKDDSPFVFAGLWEGWKDPANDQWLHTCTIITGEPNELVAQIHTRYASDPGRRASQRLVDQSSWERNLNPVPCQCHASLAD